MNNTEAKLRFANTVNTNYHRKKSENNKNELGLKLNSYCCHSIQSVPPRYSSKNIDRMHVVEAALGGANPRDSLGESEIYRAVKVQAYLIFFTNLQKTSNWKIKLGAPNNFAHILSQTKLNTHWVEEILIVNEKNIFKNESISLFLSKVEIYEKNDKEKFHTNTNTR